MNKLEVQTNASEQLKDAIQVLEIFDEIDEKAEQIKNKIGFFTTQDIKKLTGWSMPAVHALFNRPDFPASDYGRQKIVFIPAFYEYFMKPVKTTDFIKIR